MWRRAAVLGLMITCVSCGDADMSAVAVGASEEWAGTDLVDLMLHSAELNNCIDNPGPETTSHTTIWMVPDANADEVAEVDWRLENEPDVSDYDYADQDQVYAEFREFFADEPGLLEVVEPGQLPTEFTIRFERADRARAMAKDLEFLPGVDEIIVRADPSACQAEISALTERCASLPKSFELSTTEIETVHTALAATSPWIDEATDFVELAHNTCATPYRPEPYSDIDGGS